MPRPRRHRRPPTRRTDGFTIIETMIVLAIVAAVMVIAFSALGALTNARLRAETMKVSGALRLVYGRAAINGIRYQVVIDLDSDEFWAECSETNVVVDADAEEERDDARPSRYEEDDEEADPFGLGNGPSFQGCDEPLFERRKLGERLHFSRVLTTHQRDPADDGQVAIAFFPNGFVERSLIWLESDSGAVMTLSIDPMTGRVRVFAEDLDVPEDFFEVEEERD